MDYHDALGYLESFTDYEKRTGYAYSEATFDLRRPRELLALLGDPQRRFPSLLVAGTKGKGSIAIMIASILRASGRRVGLYSSPHLHTFRERIRIDDRLISGAELAIAVEAVAPAVEHLLDLRPELGPPTTYEVATAAAMLFFAERSPDLVVLEVGLGGRLDAANVVEPLVSVITPISLDHTAILGDTIEQIAAEKAGIIKDSGVVVAAEQTAEAMAVIRRVAAERDARLIVASYRPSEDGRRTADRRPQTEDEETGVRSAKCEVRSGELGLRTQHPALSTQDPGPRTQDSGLPQSSVLSPQSSARSTQHERTAVRLRGPSGTEYRVDLPLLGAHQMANAATAIAVVEQLAERGFPVNREAVERGLASVRWPGRLEIVCRDPLVVVDGAHNGDSARKLAAALRECFAYRRLILVLGTSSDKDVEGIIAALAPGASTVIATRSRHARAADPDRLAAEARRYCPHVETTLDLPSALALATALASPADLICVTGSLFTVADAREQYGLADERD